MITWRSTEPSKCTGKLLLLVFFSFLTASYASLADLRVSKFQKEIVVSPHTPKY